MKLKKRISLILCLVLIVSVVLPNNMATVRAADGDVTVSISIAEGTTAPTNYSVDWEFLDKNGQNISSGVVGNGADSVTIKPSEITGLDQIKFKVSSAGYSIRLNGADVTSEGWENGKTVTLTDLSDSYGNELKFELFQSQSNPSQPTNGNLTFTFDSTSLSYGEVQWKDSNGNWITAQNDGDVNAVAVRINYSNEGSLAGHTSFWVDGKNILLDSAVKSKMETDDGYTLDANKSYSFDHIEFVGSNQGGNLEDNPGGNQEQTQFSGTAYFIWQGENDALCVHAITGFKERTEITYIPCSTVRDDNSGEQFTMSNENYYWGWESAKALIDEKNITTFSGFEALVKGMERDYLVDPTGAVDGNSTICTNGDRAFRATIYDDTTFEGVAFARDEDDYTYFPAFWDSTFFTNTVDISGTTATNPAVYESFLLEPTIKFEAADNSVGEFTSVTPLGVPKGAVTVNNSNGEYEIEFASNFFDNVVFEIATEGGNYYLEIARTAIQVHDNLAPGITEKKITAQVYYTGKESYTDYEVYATLHYADGTTELKKLSAGQITTDSMSGDSLPAGTYELDGGKGLKYAEFSVSVTDDVVGVDFNAINSGALSGDTYGGSYFGSEKGVTYDIEKREVIY